jgi:hypothetical protein
MSKIFFIFISANQCNENIALLHKTIRSKSTVTVAIVRD